MPGPERTRQLGLHRLRRTEGGVQPGMLPRERLVALVDLVREEDGLGLAVGPEHDRLRCRTLPPEPCQDPGKSLPDLRQRVHVNGHRTGHDHSVLKLVQLRLDGGPAAGSKVTCVVIACTSESLSIQQVAQRTGFSEPTLRYYEQIGLFGPVERDESSGHRRYGPGLVETIESLACLRTSGMPIEDMRSYLELLPRGLGAAAALRELFASHAYRIAGEIARLEARHRYLQAKTALWAARERGDAKAEAEALDSVTRAIEGLR